MKLLVTGASGQLGRTFKALAAQDHTAGLEWVFASKATLDVTDADAVAAALASSNYAYCINCAAYTQVDEAEKNYEQAHAINTLGASNLAIHCQRTQTILFHISTDYVFDGTANTPYTEAALPHPTGVYGRTKYRGEQAIIQNNNAHFILRTSWLYSEFGHNFMKTILRLAQERDTLSVVYDQVGTPTYARDLARAILHIICTQSTSYGLYHCSNQGVASRYDFAQAIVQYGNRSIRLNPIRSQDYPTPAQRPLFSVLDTSKLQQAFGIALPHWHNSLQQALQALE